MPPITSTMLPLGSVAPDFRLPDPNGVHHTLCGVAGPVGVLVAFICNHCPFVKHVQVEFSALSRELIEGGIGVVAVNANDSTQQPEDSPERMLDEIERVGYPFPYVVDRSQAIARAYRAACTPDFFLFDAKRRLFYRGQMDDSRPSHGGPATGRDLRQAADALGKGLPPPEQQHPSIGCGIKWSAGTEPTYGDD